VQQDAVTPTFTKLNLRDQREIVVLNAPPEFEPELQKLSGVRLLREPAHAAAIGFALAFAVTVAQRDAACAALAASTQADPILWIAYPKASSKRYACEFNRYSGWEVLRSAGYDSVRMVVLDADWSALRFRRMAQISPAPAQARRRSAPAAPR
jgi:hypothetical protein